MLTRPTPVLPFAALLCLALLTLGFARSAAAKDNWIEVDSPHFIVLSNAGEGEARRMADQFEKFRAMFHVSFPSFRLDLGKPLVIFAVKNEDGLKVLLPGYYGVKGRVHPDGFFMPGEERDLVAVRTNVETDNPYQVVYHEYTHAIMDLNYRGLPIWLGEGLAEFFGNSTIRDKDIKIGKVSQSHLQVLQENRLIPIDALLQADAHSPYYNEQNRAGVFYAESWAIVHYLMLDPDARKRQLLFTFLKQWDATNDQLEAARMTFGDLKKFGDSMERYARQRVFYEADIQSPVHDAAKAYPVRPLAPAEIMANSSIFLTHTARFQEAQVLSDEALQSDPNLALAHEAGGLLSFFKQDFPAAEKEFQRATELSGATSAAFYYLALCPMRQGHMSPEQMALVTSALERAIQLNPEFAPAYSSLGLFYSLRPATYDRAFATGKKAVELEPGSLRYAVNLGYVLVNIGKTDDAKYLAKRIQAAARTPEEMEMAGSLLQAADARASMSQYVRVHPPANSSTSPTISDVDGNDNDADPPSKTPEPKESSAPSTAVLQTTSYRLTGKITAADCKPAGELVVTLSVNSVFMRFHAADWKSVEITPLTRAIVQANPSCGGWKSSAAEIVFHGDAPGEFDGDVVAIHFR